MKQYLNLMDRIVSEGSDRGDRTGTGTRSLFGAQMRFDLSKGFPILTTKRVAFKSVVAELLWFLSGSSDNRELNNMGCTIWDEWALDNGDLGPIYGKQWRSWECPNGYVVDQISEVIEMIKTNPTSRRLIVSGWNPADLPDETLSPQDNVLCGKAALPPCHTLFQFYVSEGKLSCQLYQRSADFFLGVPFNIASYALLTHIIAKECGLEVGDFVHTFGDLHLYQDHLNNPTIVDEQLSRAPKQLPILAIADGKGVFDYSVEDFSLIGYEPYSAIRAEVSV